MNILLSVTARFFSIAVAAAMFFALTSLTAVAMGKEAQNISPLEYRISDGTVLKGWVSLPPGSKGQKLPGIILIHGGSSLSEKNEKFGPRHFLEMKEVQKSIGSKYAVFSVEYKSNYFGDALEFESITAAYKKFISEPYVDSDRVATVGISHGGFLALLSALDPSNGVKAKAVADISGVVDLEMHVRFYEKKIKEEPKLADYDKYAVSGVKKALGWPPDRDSATKENYRKRSALSFVGSSNIPILVVHGEKDKFVPFEHATALNKEAEKRGKKIEFKPIRGWLRGNHFLIAGNDSVWEAVMAFLEKNI